MKPNVILLFFIITLLGSGCARNVQFKVIDGRSGAPLGGVETTWLEGQAKWFLSLNTNSVVLPPTGDDGVVIAKGIKTNGRHHLFRFSKTGYSPVEAELRGSRLEFRIGKSTNTVPDVANVFQELEVKVPMFKWP